jgi:ribose transport system substrate-binding protein
MRVRRSTAIRLAAVVSVGALFAVGCGSDDTDSDPADTASGEPTPVGSAGGDESATPASDIEPKIALVLPFTGIAFMENQLAGAEAAVAADGNIDFRSSAPPAPDPAGQVRLVEDAVSAGAEGVITQPIAPDLFATSLQRLANGGTEVATITIRGADGTPGVYVGHSEFASARPASEFVVETLGADAEGSIVLGLCSEGIQILDERNEAFTSQITELAPGIEIVGPIVTSQEQAANLANWESIVAANPDALAFLGNCPFDGLSLATINADGSAPWVAGTYGLGPEILDGVASGALDFAIDELEYTRAYVAVTLLAQSIRGERELPQGWIDTGFELVTSDNVATVAERYNSSGDEAATLYQPFIDAALASDTRPMSELLDG